jgi:5'-phosphate synthase pdxT subunit
MAAGILALQGDWEAHAATLAKLGVETCPVRRPRELDRVESLVLPGGESTAMLRLMAPDGLDDAIRDRVRAGMPVLATCAGLILLAHEVEPAQPSLGLLDVDVVRNAYGRQLHSTVAEVDVVDQGLGDANRFEAVFIRAPKISRIGPGVRVLGRRGSDPAVVLQERILAVTFHPELTDDHRIHSLFCELGEA